MKKNFFVGESRGLEVVSKTLSLAKAVIRLATSNRQVLKSGERPIITERCKMARVADRLAVDAESARVLKT